MPCFLERCPWGSEPSALRLRYLKPRPQGEATHEPSAQQVLVSKSPQAQTLDVWVHQHSDDSRPHLSSHPHFWASLYTLRGFPGGSDGKESASNVGDWGSIPGSGGCPGKGNGYPLHYSCLENCMDQRSLVGHISPWDCKELDTTERLWLYSKYWGNLLCSNRNCYLIT